MRWHYIFYTAVGLALAAYLLTGVTQVRPGERAVIRRFGRVLPDKPGPGLHIGLPWGMDRVDRVPVDLVRRVVVGYDPDLEESGPTTPAGQLLTGDHNLVNVQVVINYAVVEDQLEDYIVQADRTDGLVARAAESVLAEWAAGNTVDNVLTSDRSALRRRLIEETQKRIEPCRLGIRIQEASIAYLLPPAQVKDAFDEVTRAHTQIDTNINRAKQDAKRTEQTAQAEEYGIKKQIVVYEEDQKRRAKVDAGSFAERLRLYQQTGKDKPAFLRFLWWEEMGRLLTQMGENGQIDLLDHYLTGDGLDITQFSPIRPRKK